MLVLNINGMLLQAFFWFGSCTYMAFMITTLIDYGWQASSAASAITAMAIIAMLVQPVYGFISDKYLLEKKLTVSLLAATAVLFALLPLSLGSGNMFFILLNMTGITVTGMQINGLLDAWIVGLKQEFPSINYGLIRGCGSFAYALSAQLMGAVTVSSGHDMRMWIGCGFIALTAVAALTFRSARRGNYDNAQQCAELPDIKTEKKSVSRLTGMEALRLVFSSKKYILLLSVSFFLLLSNAAITTLIQLLTRDFGGTTAQIGTATAVMAFSEVPFMFMMAFLIKKTGYKKLLIVCSLAYAVRMFITASVSTVNGLIYVQLLQGLSYAVLLPVSMSYLSQIIDERVRSTAVTVYTAVTNALTGILGNLITSAFLTAGFSAQNALVFFVISALIGFILTLYGWIRKIWDITA